MMASSVIDVNPSIEPLKALTLKWAA